MDETPPEADALSPELATLCERIRHLIDAAVTTRAPLEILAAATAEIDAAEARLRQHVPDPPPPRYPRTLRGVGEMFPYDPFVGRFSPLSVPVRVEWEDPVAVGKVRFDTPYEGPPGCVHGGVIAATFDQVFNVANLMRGVAGPTRRLEITYKKPTPLRTELRFEAWQERVEEREVHTVGRVVAGDRITVEARGTFVQLSPERVMRLLER